MFEIQGVVNKFPISCCCPRDPRFTTIVVHGSKGFGDDWVICRGGGDFLGQGGVDGADMKILVFSFQKSDFSIIIAGFDFVLSGESISRPHVDSSLHPPPDVIFL